jgi:broad specificity phosphatase PhoE
VDGTRLVLVRHGQSVAQETGIIAGHDACQGLSDVGRRQATALAERLRRTGELDGTSAVYSSVMRRAEETAAIVAPAVGIDEPIGECDFCEHHPGVADGMAWDDFEEAYPQPATWDVNHRRMPGSETWQEMQDRVTRGFDTVLERHPGETVVVVCHGGVVVHAMRRWLDLSPSPTRRPWLEAHNTSLTEWRFAPHPFVADGLPIGLIRFNDHAHLADLG